jgi:hypothetical protein
MSRIARSLLKANPKYLHGVRASHEEPPRSDFRNGSNDHRPWRLQEAVAAPAIGRDLAREVVDVMLAWAIARHATWSRGAKGDHTINRY